MKFGKTFETFREIIELDLEAFQVSEQYPYLFEALCGNPVVKGYVDIDWKEEKAVDWGVLSFAVDKFNAILEKCVPGSEWNWALRVRPGLLDVSGNVYFKAGLRAYCSNVVGRVSQWRSASYVARGRFLLWIWRRIV